MWDLARLHPERVRAVVGVSVPYTFWPGRPIEVLRMLMGDRFFYILYFQPVGPAEAELEADPRDTMAKVLWGGSGEGFRAPSELPPAEGTGFLTRRRAAPAALVLADRGRPEPLRGGLQRSPASSGRSATTATWTPTTTCSSTDHRRFSRCRAATSRATRTSSS